AVVQFQKAKPALRVPPGAHPPLQPNLPADRLDPARLGHGHLFHRKLLHDPFHNQPFESHCTSRRLVSQPTSAVGAMTSGGRTRPLTRVSNKLARRGMVCAWIRSTRL